MKRFNSRKLLFGALVAALPLLIVACLKFDDILQPKSALTDTEIEVTAQMRVAPDEDGTGRVVFGVLAPKAWNLREHAQLLLTTKDYNAVQGQPEVINEKLEPMPVSEKDPKNGLSWSNSFMQVIGMGGNDGKVEMEWVVWRSLTMFRIIDKVNNVETADVHAEVKIRLQTGIDPVTCQLGYSYCYDSFGLKRDEQRFAEAFRPIETYDQIFSTVPSVFRYGDVFGVVFAHGGTALRDAAEVYLCGTALYNGGQRAVVSTAGARNGMVRAGSRFEKYLYAREFFGLPSDAVIESLTFYFINADGNIVVRDEDNGGAEFFVPQSDE